MWLPILAVAPLLASVACDRSNGDDNRKYACADDSECVEGYVCRDIGKPYGPVCVRPGRYPKVDTDTLVRTDVPDARDSTDDTDDFDDTDDTGRPVDSFDGSDAPEDSDAVDSGEQSNDARDTTTDTSPPEAGDIQLLGGTGSQDAAAMDIDSSGNLVVVGHTDNDIRQQSHLYKDDAFVAEYNSAGKIRWVRYVQSPDHDRATDVAVDGSGNVFVVGYTSGGIGSKSSAGKRDGFVVKFDPSGSRKWDKQFGSSRYDRATGVDVDSSGNLYVSGQVGGTFNGTQTYGGGDVLLAKYTNSGSRQWAEVYGTRSFDGGKTVTVGASGAVLVVGITAGKLGSSNAGQRDAFVAKHATNGNRKWIRQLGSTSDDNALAVREDGNSHIAIAGWSNGSLPSSNSNGNKDAFGAEFDGSGNRRWIRQFGTVAFDRALAVAVDGSNNVYVGGSVGDDFAGKMHAGDSTDAVVVKFSPSGQRQWVRMLGSAGGERINDLAFDGSGALYATGYLNGTLGGQSSASGDVFVARIK